MFILDKQHRLDVLELLRGDVCDEGEPAVLAKMPTILGEVDQNSEHVWHGLLGSPTANAFVADGT